MLLRKTRQHFHGTSNRSLSSENIHALHPPSSFVQTEIKKIPLQKLITTTSHLRKKNIKDSKQNCRYFDDNNTQNMLKPCTTQGQLKRKYQGSRQILKILKNWGITSKGCLSREQFKERVKKKINKNIQEQQLDYLFQNYSQNNQQINLPNLISLFKGKTEGIPFNFRTFSTEQSLPFRDKLIDDLSQNLRNFKKVEKKELTDTTLNAFIAKFNSAVSKMKKINLAHINQNKEVFFEQIIRLRKFNEFEKELLTHVQLTSDFNQLRQFIVTNKSVDYLLADPILRNTRSKVLKTLKNQNETEKQLQYTRKIQSSPQLLLTTQIKRKDFDPKSLQHVNQAKTRFGRSLFTKDTNGWVATQNSQTILPNQKDKILNTLKIQQQRRKTLYQNKLNKIREMRSKEIQSVAKRSSDIQQRKQGSLLRIREQQEAYNYVNFIKKIWE